MSSSPESDPKFKRRLKQKDAPIDLDDDEQMMIGWLRDNKKKKKVSKDSDESDSEGAAPRKKVRKPTASPPGSPKARAKKFEAEKTGILSFLQQSGSPASSQVKHATPPAPLAPKTTITDVASFFAKSSKAPKSDFDWNEDAGVKFDAVDPAPKTTPCPKPPLQSANTSTLPSPTIVASPAIRKLPSMVVELEDSPPVKKPKSGSQKTTDTPSLPWSGQSVVLSGVLTSLGRDEASHAIEKFLGGKVTSAVSGKTAFLVLGGVLEDGRPIEEGSKFKKAEELRAGGKPGPQIVKEDELQSLLSAAGWKGVGEVLIAREQSGAGSSPPQQPGNINHRPPSSTMWTEKYRPHSLGELTGNASQVAKLNEWLRDWHSVVVKGNKKQVSFRAGETGGNINSKAVLVSGSPGIGKTSAVKIVCEANGYRAIELNASDARSKSAVEELAGGLAGNTVINFGSFGESAQDLSSSVSSRVCLVMDEVDGMSAGDRGGSAALIQLIKNAKIPVICICNDRMHQKVRSLANHCFDLRFSRPSNQEVTRRAIAIARAEGLVGVDEAQLTEVSEASGGDIRQVVNWMELRSKIETPKDVSKSSKDSQNMQTAFDVTRSLLTTSSARTMNFSARLDSVFVDYDLIPLLIQQNYPRCVASAPNAAGALHACSVAADFISSGDRIAKSMRQTQNWSLLSEYCAISSVAPAYACNNILGFPEFPAWLGKNSTQNKSMRLLREAKAMLGGSKKLSTSLELDLIYGVICGVLKGETRACEIAKGAIRGTEEPVALAVALLNHLELPKDFLTEHLTELRSLPNQPDLYSPVDSKIKAAFTRSYNASEGRMRVAVVGGSKVRGAGEEGLGEDVEEARDEEDEVEDKKLGGLVKAAKPKAKAVAKKTSK